LSNGRARATPQENIDQFQLVTGIARAEPPETGKIFPLGIRKNQVRKNKVGFNKNKVRFIFALQNKI